RRAERIHDARRGAARGACRPLRPASRGAERLHDHGGLLRDRRSPHRRDRPRLRAALRRLRTFVASAFPGHRNAKREGGRLTYATIAATVTTAATHAAWTWTARAWARVAASSPTLAIGSMPASMFRRPRAASRTHVWARTCRSESAAIHAGRNRSIRQGRGVPD